ncbi:hypothetical protein EYF80_022357 [Liparis tanakae]|uniref:Uncharacterized protein n=1 Tax=Liparis tanakae TaxID=230148 RepID=A0A4Z2HRI5_9TELE|nr:hypothetical protein EYF80_022357 [Liparis tanakae]
MKWWAKKRWILFNMPVERSFSSWTWLGGSSMGWPSRLRGGREENRRGSSEAAAELVEEAVKQRLQRQDEQEAAQEDAAGGLRRQREHRGRDTSTCQKSAATATVVSSENITRRSEMRQKCLMPFEAMTLFRPLTPDPWAEHSLLHSLSLVWKPHSVMRNTRWLAAQKDAQTTKPGIIRYHRSRSLSLWAARPMKVTSTAARGRRDSRRHGAGHARNGSQRSVTESPLKTTSSRGSQTSRPKKQARAKGLTEAFRDSKNCAPATTPKQSKLGSARHAFIRRATMTAASAASSATTLTESRADSAVLAAAKPTSSSRSAEVRKAGRHLARPSSRSSSAHSDLEPTLASSR